MWSDDFFTRGSPPRRVGALSLLAASAHAIFGHFAWVWNSPPALAPHRYQFVRVAQLALLAAVSFLIALLAASLWQFSRGLEKNFLDALQSVLNRSFLSELVGRISNFMKGESFQFEASSTLPIVVMAYFLVRTIQHLVDRKSWHVPWSTAHWSRAGARLGFGRERDFPCIVIGVGGSGKSTLAAILEQTYLSRRLIKFSRGGDVGEERETISRGAGESGIGGEILPYTVSWAPARYRVGRMADVYDLPGQIVDDWVDAFAQMSASHDRKSPRRFAIFHVVSNGFNANIRKFKPDKVEKNDNKTGSDFRAYVDCGKIPYYEEQGGNPVVPNKYLREYNAIYRQREIDAFRQFASRIAAQSYPRNKETIEVLLLHVVGMAHHWAEFQVTEEAGVRLDMDKSIEVKDFYLNELADAHADLRQMRGVSLTVDILPASLQFGDVTVKIPASDKELKLFGATGIAGKERARDDAENDKKPLPCCEEHDLPYEDESRLKVLRHSALAHATMKTVRALRLALHRKPERWFDQELPTRRPEIDIFDQWREQSS